MLLRYNRTAGKKEQFSAKNGKHALLMHRAEMG